MVTTSPRFLLTDSEHESDSYDGEQFDHKVRQELDQESECVIEYVNEVVLSNENGVGHQVEVNIVEDDASEEWREWSEGDLNFEKFVWSQVSGFKPPMNEIPKTPFQYFNLFFTDSLLTEIVKETNKYASEKIQKNTPLPKKSAWWSWTEVTLSELKAFFGVIINMGMNEKPEITDYFSSDWVDYQPFFKDVFSKERFLQIFWNFHVSPLPPPSGSFTRTLDQPDKVGVENIAAYLDTKFREHYVPQNKVRLDESTIGYKGRIVFKVNNDKPMKWGIRVVMLIESSTGYVCAIEPYFGKSTVEHLDMEDLGSKSCIVLHLVNKLRGSYGDIQGLHVFTDRYYTNLDLATALLNWKVHLTGTIMLNRSGLPEIVKPQRKNSQETLELNLKKGEHKTFRKSDRFSLLIWKDKSMVSILSTLYADNTTQTDRRVQKGQVQEEVQKPSVVCKYHESIGGVNTADQYISSYSFSRKSINWSRKMLFLLMEMAIVNSCIIYNANQEEKNKVLQRCYRKMLVKELVGEERNLKKRGRPSNSDDERLNGKLHLPYSLTGGKARDCAVCSDRRPGKERKRTASYCKTCPNNPGLHIGECFQKYHSEKKYKMY